MTDNLKYEELEGLSEAEKEAVLKILSEYSEEGSSKTLKELQSVDFKEIPVDIETFLTDDRYLGKAWKDAEGNSKLYPFWLEKLKILFPDNITTSVNNYIESGARGLGKSEVAVGAACSYMMYRVMCLRNPLEYFGLKPTEKVCFAFMNITKTLAEEIAVDKFQKTIQMSPWFRNHGTIKQKNSIPYWEPPEPISIIIGSQSSHVIGQPIYFAFFDEISFIRNQDIDKQKAKAIDMIDTAIGGMKTRFIKNGINPTLLILASSKRSEKSFLEEHMKKKLASEKENVLIVDEPVWKVKPKGTYSNKFFRVALGNKYLQSQIIPDDDESDWQDRGYKILDVPVDFRVDFQDDIDRALCDFAGISSSEISKYISGIAVHDVVSTEVQNPFTRDILEIGNGPDDTAQYYDSFDLSKVTSQMKSRPLFIHLDMSVSGDMTGIAGVWIKGKKPSTNELSQASDLFYQLAFSVSIKAPKGRQVSFEKNRNFIYWLKEQGFAIKGVSSDTFQSYDTGQALKAKGYNYDVLSVDRVDSDHICKPYQYFKSTIYEKRILMYNSKTLVDEIIDLERNINTGKVDHPDGGCFTGDTKVRLVDGRTLTFLELVDEYISGKKNFVYSFNSDKKCIEPKPIRKAWLTKKNQPLIRITLDNGEYVECTLNHKFMLRDGSYIEAQDLIPGDSLMPLYTRVSDKGLEGYRMYYEPMKDSWHYEHRNFAEEVLDEKYLVHHKNCNKLDNSPSNLIWMSKQKHIKELFGFEYDSIEPKYKAVWNNRYRATLYNVLNHKVVSVEILDKTEDVYDIEVEDNHNFALDCGVFVHNSKDVCDAVCGAMFNASKHAEEFAFEYGETLEHIVNVSSSEGEYDKKQITVDFEQELTRTLDGLQEYKQEVDKHDEEHFQDFGMGKATTNFNPRYLSNGIII